jgi:hypothetical protein
VSTTIRFDEERSAALGCRCGDDASDPSEELRRFAMLQARLNPMFRRLFSDDRASRTVVVIPSMTLDPEELVKLEGAAFYEERLLCLLLLLRLPATRVVYVTSQAIAPSIVDYYLQLLPLHPRADAWRRLTLLSCHDPSTEPLTANLLARPDMIARMRAAVDDPMSAHMTCFNVTELERSLAVQLGVPIYGCDPALAKLGTKSGSRDVFLEAGVATPPGFGHLRDPREIIGALTALKHEHPSLEAAVLKLNEGFSGEGNAIFSYDGAPTGRSLSDWVRSEFPRRVRFVAPAETWERYQAKFARMGGIVEAMVHGTQTRSPSVQCRINPLGETQIISTHEQLLGGETGQVYLGCEFPAQPGGRDAMHTAAAKIGHILAERGVVGRFAIDFVTTRDRDRWNCHAIEINIRKGGTTHPFLTLEQLTGGRYDRRSGEFRTAAGRPCHYVASDNICHPAYTNLEPEQVLEAVRGGGLHFDPEAERGVVFHLLGALPAFGKLGATAIGRTPDEAKLLFRRTITILDCLSGRTTGGVAERAVYEAPAAFAQQ